MSTIVLGGYEQFEQRDPCWSFIQLHNYFKLALLDETKELMNLFQGHRLSLKTFFYFQIGNASNSTFVNDFLHAS